MTASSRLLFENVDQGVVDMSVSKGEAEICRAHREGTLAAKKQCVSHFAERQPERKPWCRQQARPFQRATKSAREFPIGDRLWARGVDRAPRGLGGDGPHDEPDPVVFVNPGHVLPAGPERSSRKQHEG